MTHFQTTMRDELAKTRAQTWRMLNSLVIWSLNSVRVPNSRFHPISISFRSLCPALWAAPLSRYCIFVWYQIIQDDGSELLFRQLYKPFHNWAITESILSLIASLFDVDLIMITVMELWCPINAYWYTLTMHVSSIEHMAIKWEGNRVHIVWSEMLCAPRIIICHSHIFDLRVNYSNRMNEKKEQLHPCMGWPGWNPCIRWQLTCNI